MKNIITVSKQGKNLWRWFIATPAGETLAGGYARTKKNALNDALIVSLTF